MSENGYYRCKDGRCAREASHHVSVPSDFNDGTVEGKLCLDHAAERLEKKGNVTVVPLRSVSSTVDTGNTTSPLVDEVVDFPDWVDRYRTYGLPDGGVGVPADYREPKRGEYYVLNSDPEHGKPCLQSMAGEWKGNGGGKRIILEEVDDISGE